MRILFLILISLIVLKATDYKVDIYSFEDKTNSFSYEEILAKTFTKIKTNSINKGLSKNNYWIKINIQNNTNKKLNKVLLLNNPSIDFLEFYNQNNYTHRFFTGDHKNLNTRDIKDINFAFNIIIEANKTNQFYLKISTANGVVIKFDILSKEKFEKISDIKKIILSIFFGFILAIIIYNILLYFMLKENIYLYYVTFQISLFMMLLSASGYGYYFLWQNNSFINELIMKHFDDIALIFAVLFSKSFLNTKQYYPFIDKILNIFLFLLFIVLISTGYIHMLLVKPVMIGVILVIFFTSILALIEHKSKVKYYFTGWLFMITGSLLMLSQNFGWIEPSFLTNWSLYIASMFEAILFSMALAQKIELLKQEKKEALQLNQDKLEFEVKRKTLSLNEALKQKEILLKEIHHRVKNNLQIISSFITIAMLKSSDIQTKDIFNSLQDRIRAVSLLHEYLYKHENLDLIDIKQYIYNLVEQISNIYEVKNIKFDFDIDDIKLEFDKIILLGLIINEIVTNSLKYAFINKLNPKIEFKLKSIEKNKFYLEIIDNGSGFDTDIDLKKSKTLGLKMIHRLTTKQLNGELEFKSSIGETTFKIYF